MRLIVLLLLCLNGLLTIHSVAFASSDIEKQYFNGNVNEYPVPKAISRVQLVGNIPTRSAFKFSNEAGAGVANQAVRVSIDTAGFRPKIGSIPSGKNHHFLVLETQWENIHPRQKVSRKSLAGKADRTMGAGGLFSGQAEGHDIAADFAEKDVAYTIPKWDNHLFLVADGIAYGLSPASVGLEGAIHKENSFSMARKGQRKKVRLVFDLPKSAKNLGLLLLDYSNGHIRIPLHGDWLQTPTNKGSITAQQTSNAFDLTIVSATETPDFEGVAAPDGWKYVVLELIGKSKLSSAAMGNMIQMDPARDVWLFNQQGFATRQALLAYGEKYIRFLPDYYLDNKIAYLIPASETAAELSVRAKSDMLHFNLGRKISALPQQGGETFVDGTTMKISLLGKSSSDGLLLLDIDVQNLRQKSGLELNPFRQLTLIAQGKPVHPARQETLHLAHGARDKMIVPPASRLRFLLAFKGVKTGAELKVAGFEKQGKVDFSLLKTEIPAAYQQVQAPILKQPTQAPAQQRLFSAGENVGVHHSKDQQTKTLPVLDLTPPVPLHLPEGVNTTSATEEQEPNNKLDSATPLGKSLMGKGVVAYDHDYFSFESKETAIWAVELQAAADSNLRLVYIDAQGRQQFYRNLRRQSVLIPGLYLLPGKHTFEVFGSHKNKPVEYLLRVVRVGIPDPDDEMEPNDTRSQARKIAPGEVRRGSIDGDNDTDNYRFSLTGSRRVRISLRASATLKTRFSVSGGVGESLSANAQAPGGSLTVIRRLTPGDYELTVRGRPTGTYALFLETLDPYGSESAPKSGLAIDVPGFPHDITAFLEKSQTISFPVRIHNSQATPITFQLKIGLDSPRWTVDHFQQQWTLAPGASISIPIRIHAPPDISEDTHSVWLHVEDSQKRQTAIALALNAVCGAPAQHPDMYWPLPSALLGGLNIARPALGGKPVTKDEGDRRRLESLFDDDVRSDNGFRKYFRKDEPATVTVKLHQGQVARVAGMSVNPMGNCAPQDWANHIELQLSSDGKVFQKVLAVKVRPFPHEQVFTLKKPVSAAYARLKFLDRQGKGRNPICLGEWKIIASPEQGLFAGGLNIAQPELGGHLVRSYPALTMNKQREMLSEAVEKHTDVSLEVDRPNEWIVGFQHDRAALIHEFQWIDTSAGYGKKLSNIEVFSGMNLFGPWEKAGSWHLMHRPGQPDILKLKTPVWARYVRFITSDPVKRESWQLPAVLRIIEQPERDGYRSIVGEWGENTQAAVFEWQQQDQPAAGSVPANSNDNNDKTLVMEQPQTGEVELDRHMDRYSFTVPKAINRISLDFTSADLMKLSVILKSASGKEIPLQRQGTGQDKAHFSAEVTPGQKLVLGIREDKRNIIISWDNSGSVSNFLPQVYPALASLTRGVVPGQEYLNFLPFQDRNPKLLLKDWTDQPLLLQKTLNNYDRKDNSSEAELNLLTAVRQLNHRVGARAVILLTDADTGDNSDLQRKLWNSLDKVRPAVFSIELHRGGNAGYQQDKMQSWAHVAGGYYSAFVTQNDLDKSIARAFCRLRRPVHYQFLASQSYQKPAGPGFIAVKSGGAQVFSAVEIIFDASGSMYKKIGKQTRIAIAKRVMTNLLKTSIPANTPMALRIFGHREPRSCRTDLEIPLQPLQVPRMLSAINKIDPKNRSKTPLAASIAAVEKDLKAAKGQKLILLLTDGEESCGGDPEMAIAQLKKAGLDVRVNIVGFAIKDKSLQENFSAWARAGSGLYFNASNEKELQTSLAQAMLPKFQLLDEQGDVVAEGVSNGEKQSIDSGHYTLRIFTEVPIKKNVVIHEGVTTIVNAAP